MIKKPQNAELLLKSYPKEFVERAKKAKNTQSIQIFLTPIRRDLWIERKRSRV
jgi:hypothetical protein